MKVVGIKVPASLLSKERGLYPQNLHRMENLDVDGNTALCP
jgi:hypothetical protein